MYDHLFIVILIAKKLTLDIQLALVEESELVSNVYWFIQSRLVLLLLNGI